MLYKNVWKTLSRKWVQLLAIIIVMSSLTYTMMFYGISGIEVPTEEYLEESNQEDFAIDMLNRVTEEELRDTPVATLAETGVFTLADIKQADAEVFNRLIASRIVAVEQEMPDATIELRDLKAITYTFDDTEHRGIIVKESDTINRSYLEAGERPSANDEIALNKKYAEENRIDIGDTIDLGKPFTVSGFVLFPDYTLPLFDDNFWMVSEKIDNPRLLRKSEAKVKKAQRALSRKKIGSKNREKARLILAKRHEKIANQRKDFLHKLSRRIVDENQVIVVETLKSKDMMKNHKVAKSIADVSWYEFVRQLEYKSNFYGRTLIKADPWYASTQICSSCGEKGQKKTMDVREWTCACGAHHDRDINATINLLMLAD